MDKNQQKKILIDMMEQDDKLGLYKQQTAVDWLFDRLWEEPKDKFTWYIIVEKAKQMEREQLLMAMMHALDEDGHTGDWKIKFVNDYYNKTFTS